MSTEERQALKQALADEDARDMAARQPLSEARQALYALLQRYHDDPGFWPYVVEAGSMGPDAYAKLCRICGRPMFKAWRQCICSATSEDPQVITGAVVTEREIEA
jgi:hypothetical protein